MRPPSRAPRSWHAVGVTLTILLTAAVLRSPIVAVAPVAREVGADLGVSAGVVGLLTSIPVLAFAVCAPLAVVLIRRCGADLALTITLAGSVAGCLVRSFGGLAAVMVGTAMIGLFLTIGNVVVPIIIKREYPPARVAFMTGVYTSAINVGTMLVTLTTAPLAAATDWRVAIAVWGGFGLAALATWIGTLGVRALVPTAAPRAADSADGTRSAAWAPSTWFLAVAFAGQAFGYYAVSAWLPSLLHDTLGLERAASGGAASLFQLFGMVGGIAVPIALGRRAPVAAVSAAITVGWVALPVGLLLAPAWWPLWCTLAGVAQGGNFAVIFTVIASSAGSAAAARRMSATVQTIGYGCAALGPSVLGAVHSSSGGWTVPLLVVLAAVLTMGLSSALGLRSMQREP